jgi:hypothetical protein
VGWICLRGGFDLTHVTRHDEDLIGTTSLSTHSYNRSVSQGRLLSVVESSLIAKDIITTVRRISRIKCMFVTYQFISYQHQQRRHMRAPSTTRFRRPPHQPARYILLHPFCRCSTNTSELRLPIPTSKHCTNAHLMCRKPTLWLRREKRTLHRYIEVVVTRRSTRLVSIMVRVDEQRRGRVAQHAECAFGSLYCRVVVVQRGGICREILSTGQFSKVALSTKSIDSPSLHLTTHLRLLWRPTRAHRHAVWIGVVL